MLGSEYSWHADYILEKIYFDDYVELSLLIQKRMVRNLRLQLAITMNPHLEDPSTLWDILEQADIPDLNGTVAYDVDSNAKLDKTSFMTGKMLMASNPRITVK